jgi:hypothetical protein
VSEFQGCCLGGKNGPTPLAARALRMRDKASGTLRSWMIFGMLRAYFEVRDIEHNYHRLRGKSE